MVESKNVPPPKSSILYRRMITLHQLIGGMPILSSKEDENWYRLAFMSLYPYRVDSPEGTEYVVSTTGITGKQLVQFHLLAAPSKFFGVDRADTIKDWHNLFADPKNSDRLDAHKTIPGWAYFEKYRERLLELIIHAYDKPRVLDAVIPLIRIKKNTVGRLTWNFDELDNELLGRVISSYDPLYYNPTKIIPILGPLIVAAFSPEVTSTWGPRISYPKDAERKGTNDSGSTQVLALTLWKAGTLLNTRFVQSAVNYLDSGQLPSQR